MRLYGFDAENGDAECCPFGVPGNCPMRHLTQALQTEAMRRIRSYRTISRGADGSVPYAEPLGRYP